ASTCGSERTLVKRLFSSAETVTWNFGSVRRPTNWNNVPGPRFPGRNDVAPPVIVALFRRRTDVEVPVLTPVEAPVLIEVSVTTPVLVLTLLLLVLTVVNPFP